MVTYGSQAKNAEASSVFDSFRFNLDSHAKTARDKDNTVECLKEASECNQESEAGLQDNSSHSDDADSMSLKSQSVQKSQQGHHHRPSTSLTGDAQEWDEFAGSEMILELDSPKASVGDRPTEFVPCDESMNSVGQDGHGQRRLHSAGEEKGEDAHGGGILGLSTSMFMPESFSLKASSRTSTIDVPVIESEEEVQICRRILEDVSSCIPIQTGLQREQEDLPWNIIGPSRAGTLLQSLTPQMRTVAVAMKSGVDQSGSCPSSPKQFGKRAKAMESLHFELDHDKIQQGISPTGSRIIYMCQ